MLVWMITNNGEEEDDLYQRESAYSGKHPTPFPQIDEPSYQRHANSDAQISKPNKNAIDPTAFSWQQPVILYFMGQINCGAFRDTKKQPYNPELPKGGTGSSQGSKRAPEQDHPR